MEGVESDRGIEVQRIVQRRFGSVEMSGRGGVPAHARRLEGDDDRGVRTREELPRVREDDLDLVGLGDVGIEAVHRGDEGEIAHQVPGIREDRKQGGPTLRERQETGEGP